MSIWDRLKDAGQSLFLTRDQKIEMLREWPARKRFQQQLWDIHNNYVEQINDRTWTPQTDPLLSQSFRLLDAASTHIDQVDRAIRAAIEKQINAGKMTADDAKQTGLGLIPLIIAIGLIVDALIVGIYATMRLTANEQAEAQAVLLKVKAQIDAANAGRSIPSFPASPDTAADFGSQMKRAGGGVALAAAAIAGLLLIMRRRRA